MSVTSLCWCRFCAGRVNPADRVFVHGESAHEGCAEAHYRRVAEVLGVGCSRAEGDQG